MRRSLLVVTLLALGACKGDRQQCETVCRHVFEVAYWEKADAEIAAAPADQRDKLRKKKLGDFSTRLEDGVDLCINQCVSANNKDQNKCLLAAKKAADIVTCSK
jgi:hypothetical protein